MSNTLPKLQTGRHYVAPTAGVCVLTAITHENVLGQDLTLYELKPVDGRHTLKLPQSKVAAAGVRPLSSSSDVRKALRECPHQQAPEEKPKERYARFIDVLRSGTTQSRRAVLRQLHWLEKHGLKLQACEQELRKQVDRSFRQELQHALQISDAEAGQIAREAVES
jgi:RNA polymerase-interacting CarD/CdnL/TRCF family regulator